MEEVRDQAGFDPSSWVLYSQAHLQSEACAQHFLSGDWMKDEKIQKVNRAEKIIQEYDRAKNPCIMGIIPSRPKWIKIVRHDGHLDDIPMPKRGQPFKLFHHIKIHWITNGLRDGSLRLVAGR